MLQAVPDVLMKAPFVERGREDSIFVLLPRNDNAVPKKKKEAIKEALQTILFSLVSNSASTTGLTEIKANETFSLSFEEIKRRGSVKQSNWKEKEIEKKLSTHKEEKKGGKATRTRSMPFLEVQ